MVEPFVAEQILELLLMMMILRSPTTNETWGKGTRAGGTLPLPYERPLRVSISTAQVRKSDVFQAMPQGTRENMGKEFRYVKRTWGVNGLHITCMGEQTVSPVSAFAYCAEIGQKNLPEERDLDLGSVNIVGRCHLKNLCRVDFVLDDLQQLAMCSASPAQLDLTPDVFILMCDFGAGRRSRCIDESLLSTRCSPGTSL